MSKFILRVAIVMMMCVMSLGFSQKIYAQEQELEVANSEGVLMIADTNVRDAKFIEKTDEFVEFQFSLENIFHKIQPGIKYGVRLIDSEGAEIDSKVWDESITLNPQEKKPIHIKYPIPQSLSCEKCGVAIFVKTEAGLPLADYIFNETFNIASQVESGLFIDYKTCLASISGEEEKQYLIRDGVDLSFAESLFITCNIINNGKNDVEFYPEFAIHEKNSFAEIVDKQYGEKEIAPAGIKKFRFTVPKQKKPQTYDAVMALVSKEKKVISNTITTHFVIQGESATVRNVQLDKNYYKTGDRAQVTVEMTPSADQFEGSRAMKGMTAEKFVEQKMYADVIVSGDGGLCGKATNQNIVGHNAEIAIAMESECVNPIVNVIAKNADQLVLDDVSVKIETNSKNIDEAVKNNTKDLMPWALKIAFILTIALILGIIIFRFKKGGSMGVLIFLMIGFAGVFMGSNNVYAETYVIGKDGFGHDNYVVLSLDAGSYCSSSTIRATGSGTRFFCDNWNVKLRVDWSAPGSGNLFDKGCGTNDGISGATHNFYGCSQGSTSVNRTTSGSTGNYNAQFDVTSYEWRPGWTSRDFQKNTIYIPYSVVNCPINGVCGASNGGSFVSAPAVGLCTSGVVKDMKDVGWWSWWCDGSGSLGSSVACGANKLVPINAVCGSSNGGTFASVPTVGLCSTGVAKDMKDVGWWSWWCDGSGTFGSSVSCGANKSYSCTGGNPPSGATWCSGDNTGLTSNLAWQSVTSCTNTRKCEYTMPTYSCTGGNPPSGATWCSGDNTGLTSNLAWQSVTSCTNTRKCEYTMPTYSCTDPSTGLSAIPPTGYVMCPNANIGLTQNVSWFITGSGVASCATYNGKCGCYIPPACISTCSTGPGCRASLANGTVAVSGTCCSGTCYSCATGYSWNGSACVLSASPHSCTGGNPPQGANWCLDDDISLTESLDWKPVTFCTIRKCEYTMPPNKCGSANGAELIDQPLNTCCDVGTLNWIDSAATDGKWNWQCTGDGGNPAECSATKKIASPSTSINPNEKTDDKGRLIETRP